MSEDNKPDKYYYTVEDFPFIVRLKRGGNLIAYMTGNNEIKNTEIICEELNCLKKENDELRRELNRERDVVDELAHISHNSSHDGSITEELAVKLEGTARQRQTNRKDL